MKYFSGTSPDIRHVQTAGDDDLSCIPTWTAMGRANNRRGHQQAGTMVATEPERGGGGFKNKKKTKKII